MIETMRLMRALEHQVAANPKIGARAALWEWEARWEGRVPTSPIDVACAVGTLLARWSWGRSVVDAANALLDHLRREVQP